MFKWLGLALSSHFWDTNSDTLSPCAPKKLMYQCALWGEVSSKYGTGCSERVILQFVCVGCWVGVTSFVTYLHYVTLCRRAPTKGRNSCPLMQSCFIGSCQALVMLVSRDVFHVVSALQSIVFIHYFLEEQISYRSYVSSVYRMRSLALCVTHLQFRRNSNLLLFVFYFPAEIDSGEIFASVW